MCSGQLCSCRNRARARRHVLRAHRGGLGTPSRWWVAARTLQGMSTTTEQPAASRHALPDPGERVPTISWPIVGIFFGAIAVFAFSTWAALANTLPAPATVLL